MWHQIFNGLMNTTMSTTRQALIIDSAEVVASRLHHMLNELNCFENIAIADNYSEAMQEIDTHHPDVILLDIQLPDNKGIALLRRIKEYHPSLKVIVLTNKSGENYRSLCEQIGSDHFIDKSKDFENITSIIKSYVA
ncbi:MAG: response regulator [Bacteroidetes bacterium]|nr:response regulator [Bacteroidota bacterium]